MLLRFKRLDTSGSESPDLNAPADRLASWQPPVAVQGESSSRADKARLPGGVERRAETDRGQDWQGAAASVASELGSLPFPSQLRAARHSAVVKQPSQEPETAAGTRTLTAALRNQDPPAGDSQRACQDKRNFSIYSPCLRLD